MNIKNDKELTRLRTRVKEEFIIVRGMQNADIESAMIKIDNLIDYLLERSDKCPCNDVKVIGDCTKEETTCVCKRCGRIL
jgi:hypothetical protein